MSTTLAYGRIKPQDGDIGDEIFDALENNIDLNDAHTHDGVTSAPIPSTNIQKTTQALLAANWSVVGNGIYKQTVTMSTGTFDNSIPMFRDTDDNSQYFLRAEKVAANQFDVFINDNSKNVTVYYV